MHSLTLKSPAKLNLSLKVIGRRPDGYHELVTLFHRISLCDEISFTKKAEGVSIHSSNKELPCDKSNLIAKAYSLLKEKYPEMGGISVAIKKNIPIAAGLGGGSSNAASTLLALNQLYDLRLSRKVLARFGTKLGADIPFFLYEMNQAIGAGIGEKILSRAAKGKHWFLLVVSNKGLMTKEVYRELSPKERTGSLTKEMATARILCKLLDCKDFAKASRLLRNDLEPAAFRLRASIKKMLDHLLKLGAFTARMSGSGPTIFAIFSSRKQAEQLASKVRLVPPYNRVIVCHSK